MELSLETPSLQVTTWRISDTSSASFGQLVLSDVIGNDDMFIMRGDCALVQIENKWTTASKDEGSNKGSDAFARRHQAGPRRDKRLMGDERDPDGRRFLALSAIILLLLEAAMPLWPISGPR